MAGQQAGPRDDRKDQVEANEAELTIVTAEAVTGRRGSADTVRRVVESQVSIGQLQANLAQFLEAVRGLLAEQSTRAGAFELDEIALSAEISASGELKLLGSGIAVQGGSAVGLTWRRRPDPSATANG
jgi:hypothetical protein